MIDHREGERRTKALQKAFLLWVEDHPHLSKLDPQTFDEVRHRVFRSTFTAFRLGVVGLETVKPGVWEHFFGWLDDCRALDALDGEIQDEIADRCFLTALEAFRIGAFVSSQKGGPRGTQIHDG